MDAPAVAECGLEQGGVLASGAGSHPPHFGHARARAVSVAASEALPPRDQPPTHTLPSHTHTHQERRIRYPVDDGDDDALARASGWATSDTTWAAPARWPRGAAAVRGATAAPGTRRALGDVPLPLAPDVPVSPAALLRAASVRAADAAAADASLAACYAVLDGCPWPLPRTLYLLAVPPADGGDAHDGEDGAPGTAATFRVRRTRADVASELTTLLGRATPFLDVAHMVDGVLAFDCEATAAEFADALAARPAVGGAAPRPPASLAALSSHDLFRAASGAASVVVLVRSGPDGVPDPGALAAALRSGGVGAADV